ncbi:P-loop containing nucleoside triphosphate hydrolase protein [Gongronella butleri]|nr:P-loop containing nucleoside triphosphate hydrolase protein [Gongronella butleri]
MDAPKPKKKFSFGMPTRKPVANTPTSNTIAGNNTSDSAPKDLASNREADQKRKLDKPEPSEPSKRSKTLHIDDTDELLASAGIGKPPIHQKAREARPLTSNERHLVPSTAVAPSIPVATSKVAEIEDDDDPLDAFMAGMSKQAKHDEEQTLNQPKVRRDDIEEEDEIEAYVKHMKKKGIVIGKRGGKGSERFAISQDDDDATVYATAAAVDAQLGLLQSDDDDDNGQGHGGKKDVEPLARVNHDEIEYPEMHKCFYEEHDDIRALTAAEVEKMRRDWGIRVSGGDVAKPCVSFAHFGFDDDLMQAIIKAGYTEPTTIQRQAIPVAMQGRDIFGMAKTGSGKTAAFVLPMLIHIMDQEELDKGDGPIGLILAPTHELANQIYTETKKFAKAYDLKVAVVYGGASKRDQFKTLRKHPHEIIVATPGRLIDMIKMKATNLRRVSYLVLDEADRMFDLGFVRSICDNVRPDRQVLMFSATFQRRVESLARQVTTDPVRITVGQLGQANEDVTQMVFVLADDTKKWEWLGNELPNYSDVGSVIVFVSRKDGVDGVANMLARSGYQARALHGDLVQGERDQVIRDFKASKFNILVATDVASRGLDIKSVRYVINFDMARDMDAHTHRVGRTGRAGDKGTAVTLITRKEDRAAGDLVRHLELANQIVPPALMELAMTNGKFRNARMFGRGGGRGGGRGSGHRGRGGGHRGRGARGGGRIRHGLGSDRTGSNQQPLGGSRSFGIQFQKSNHTL